MRGFLIDTNTVSELVSIRPSERVIEWFESANEDQLYLSAMTIGEIRKGIITLAPSRRRSRLEMWLDLDLHVRFAGRILPVDAYVADRWGTVMAEAAARGRRLPVVDALLAATALEHDFAMVTRNVTDFVVPGLQVIDPWTA